MATKRNRDAVAADLGVTHTTVGRWIEGARRAATAREKKVARTAMEIAESIREREAEAREALIDRMVAVASECEDDIQKLATAYGILKAYIAQGRATSIRRSPHAPVAPPPTQRGTA